MGLFGLDRARRHGEEVELLETVYDPVREVLIRDLLEREKIPFLVQERGSGDAMKILTGTSLYGTDILVPKEDHARAAELLSALLCAEESEEEDAAEGECGGENTADSNRS